MKALLLLASLVTVIPAANLKGKVVGVKDGNSIEILSEGKVIGIKLFGIDCPERDNTSGKIARHFVAEQAFMNEVQVEITGTESNGNFIGKVFTADGKNLSSELLKHGLAWWDSQSSPDEEALARLEKQAREAFKGIWGATADDEDGIDYAKDVLAKRD